ncbi:hypothetical protein CROQUDRAFT_65692 [Cronartium quercuum f. sp. fusiforme G11]|uniref:FAS1 domain-containing protein n=1 Tax=Cronartium quercuum f. sp. fusiforme G11 TaxID=708437 RepID=A0A9P6ND24_9BASI|nr:hypothetical protein CROQUDRAFT_65692 [Cronartium quercuum f. sp. fusiforme G11]
MPSISFNTLIVPFIFHLINHVYNQIPTSAPNCVQTCGRLKVTESYCNSSDTFAKAYDQCLKDNCNPADATNGLQYTTQICGQIGSAVPNATATTGNNSTPINGSDYGATLNSALQAAGLTSLAALLASSAGQGLVNQLQQGNHTVFAPTDQAFGALGLNSSSINSTNNTADLTAVLKYHVLPGTLNSSALPTSGHAIVRSSLGGQPYVNLPANDTQVLVFAGNQNAPFTVIEPTRNITVTNTTQVGNLQLAVIPTALTIPGTVGTVAASLSELSSLVSTVNGASPQLLAQLDQTPGLTIFAPINSALSGTANVSNFQAVLLNHLVNSTVLYSTVIANVTNATSAGGALLTFASSSGSETITLGSKTLKIVQSDILIKNGVIHLVDGLFDASNSTPVFPLPNTNNNTQIIGITPIGGSINNGTGQGGAKKSKAIIYFPSKTFLMFSISLTFICLLFI